MARPKKLGRPSSYKKEWPDLIKQYVNKCKEEDVLPFIKEIAYQFGRQRLSIEIK